MELKVLAKLKDYVSRKAARGCEGGLGTGSERSMIKAVVECSWIGCEGKRKWGGYKCEESFKIFK